jgi:16S rRNA (uracil1498-N3)-methyltransferase
MRRFYAPNENFTDQRIILDSEQSRHLRSVLRLKAGDEVKVFDGAGSEFLCLVQELNSGKQSSVLRILREIDPTAQESNLGLNLAVALLKSDKFDLILQKAVELGVLNFIPINTRRCDVKPKNFERKIERFERIITEASKQCGRAKLMQISDAIDFEELIETGEGAKILFAERSGAKFSEIKADKKITAVIGPEGGWEDSEIELAKQNDFQIVTLGGRILRAETAAISITSLLQHNFGDLR